MSDHPPEVLARAAGPGRVRGIGLDLWVAAKRAPERAGPTWSEGLRRARALHSAERRLVQDLLFDGCRRDRGLSELVGDEPLARWLAGLVLAGLPPERAAAEAAGPWEGLVEAWHSLGSGADPSRRLALRHGLPAALAARWVGQLGAEEAAALARASDERAPIVLRARRGTRDALRRRLDAEGVATEALPGTPDAVAVIGRANLEATRAFREGHFEVQDAGSQRLVDLIGDGPGTALDLCAGAGGKALALADRGFRVSATDVRPRALDELARRAARAGVRVETALSPSDGPPAGFAGRRFDVVLVDAPCTGTGVLRRHPTDRWRWTEDRVTELVELQGRLLERGAGLVGPGGRLVYTTCSVDRAEGEAVVEAFEARGGWRRVGEPLRTWPHRDGTDGFFGAVLRRTGDQS